MLAGMRFGDIHSFEDLNLILASASIPPASPKTNYIDIRGGDGALDLTEANGRVTYNDRDGCKFTFIMNPADDLSDSAFELKKTQVSDAINGAYIERIILDKDPDFFYSGRCEVSEYLSDKRIRKIVVTARLSTYKYKVDKTVVRCTLDGTKKTIVLKNSKKIVVPEITCTADNTLIVLRNTSVALNKGIHTVLDIQLIEGDNLVEVTGTGEVTFSYREGEL